MRTGAAGEESIAYNSNMNGEFNLSVLLRTAHPVLDPAEFVFCTLAERDIPAEAKPICVFRETEGTTLILERGEAERCGLAWAFPCRKITLTVHSALEAVGFLAAIMSELAGRGISTNAVSGFYHDHLFVPASRAEEAMAALAELAERS